MFIKNEQKLITCRIYLTKKHNLIKISKSIITKKKKNLEGD
jgi:hypothetical protein